MNQDLKRFVQCIYYFNFVDKTACTISCHVLLLHVYVPDYPE